MSDTTPHGDEPRSDRDPHEDRRPGRTVAGMSVRFLAVGTVVALIVALTVSILVGMSVDEDRADRDPADQGVIDLSGTDDPERDVLGRPVAVDYLTFDGEEANTAGYLGRPLVINLFAEWCAPCRAELPAFEAVSQEHLGHVAFLGISSEESLEDGQLLVDSTGITFDVGRDPEGDMFVLFEGTGMPTTAFVDAAGTVVEVHSGALTADELRERLADHFGVTTPAA